MPRKKIANQQEQEKLQAQQVKNEIVNKIVTEYQDQLTDRMGHLYNRFVGYISEARLPVNEVVTVLSILQKEAVEMASKRYAGR